MSEIWKPVPGFEWYEVSNVGNVRSIDREFVNQIGRKCFLKGSPIKPTIAKGYARVGIRKDAVKKMFSVHRLVALAFIPNPNNYESVNHINGDKLDNRVDNLEWCTLTQNIKHAYDNNLMGCMDNSLAKVAKINEVNSYKLIRVTSPNGKVFEFNSVKETSEYFGIKVSTINDALSKKQNRAFGYTFVGYKHKGDANGENPLGQSRAIQP